MAKVPFSTVTVLNSAPVALFLALTCAPGITAPDGSTTTPAREDVAPAWPKPGRLYTAITTNAAANPIRIRFMGLPPFQTFVVLFAYAGANATRLGLTGRESKRACSIGAEFNTA